MYFKTILLCSMVLAFLMAACNSNELKEGRWTGHLTPMNHPDMNQPIAYDVSYENNGLTINLVGPDGAPVSVRNAHLENDTLYFSFDEPEQQVPLDCRLAQNGVGFVGRCTDASGKWAEFTMNPPE